MFGYSCQHDCTLTHTVKLARPASRLLVDTKWALRGLRVLGCQCKRGHLLNEGFGSLCECAREHL